MSEKHIKDFSRGSKSQRVSCGFVINRSLFDARPGGTQLKQSIFYHIFDY